MKGKRMKSYGALGYFAGVVAIAAAAAFTSCSTYSVSKEMSSGSALGKMKSACVVLRLSRNSRIEREEQTRNLASWLSAAKQTKKLAVLSSCDDGVCSYTGQDDRFYQVDGDGRFLKYKAAGVVNEYVRANEAGLRKILADNGCDGIIIYEVYGVIALEMQFFDFDSAVCVLDRDLKPVHLDRQFDSYNVDEISAARVRQQLLDRVSERLVDALDDMGFLRR